MSMSRHLVLSLPIVAILVSAGRADAAVILSPVGATASSEFSSTFDIGNTIDQSGLSSGFTSGITDFDAYLATNPTHTLVAANFEWFTPSGVTTATVTYDLGAIVSIDRIALWNEESSGVGNVNVLFSTDGVTFVPNTLGITPVNNPIGSDYPAQVFALSAGSTRYVQLSISQCPQAEPGAFPGCGIGEVAFSSGGAQQQVPEPSSMLLFGTAAVGAIAARRRVRRS